ncbi:MBL fold metallo-hydrolase [Paenibacillus solisilvae]|uniref:MBL fold metallo-hydrolase n=1 Tax=Paenibacillus solisilvae TaxID=2486751 RepID=A0ABW0VW43_9BACL
MSKFEQISAHIWIMHAEHETDRPILAAIVGERRTLLMDAGNSPAHAGLFREALKRRGVKLPDLMVLTHWHWDHTFGMSAWGVPAIAHSGTVKTLRDLARYHWSDETMKTLVQQEMLSAATVKDMKEEYGVESERSIEIIEPDVQFEDRIRIDLGGISCEIQHVGGDHSEDSCYVYVREDKVLFLGDALGPSVYGGPRSYTSAGFLSLMDRLHEYEGVQIFVESHGVPVSRDAFLADIGEWEQLARLVALHGDDRERITEEMAVHLSVAELPETFAEAIGWFMVGVERGRTLGLRAAGGDGT